MMSADGVTHAFRFQAMANPCEVLLEGCTARQAHTLFTQLEQEVRRIEHKYSRYREDSTLSLLNRSAGQICAVDPETWQLLKLAGVLWQHSAGRFDISSGVLRKVWQFKSAQEQTANTAIPHEQAIAALMPFIGWEKTHLDERHFQMRAGMQIDFGGIGKEYAADRCADIARAAGYRHCLINLGGDVVATGGRADGSTWQVGIEATHTTTRVNPRIWRVLPLNAGAIATSGDTHRYLLHAGKRYGHILDARTGWPVENAPSSITIAAPNATEAGMICTLAMLHGIDAEVFLHQQQRPYWIQPTA